ncbi:unnamed protein product, partial [Rangifer tarandus platyrhynchus]
GQILKREPDHLSQKQLAMKSANAPRLAHPASALTGPPGKFKVANEGGEEASQTG